MNYRNLIALAVLTVLLVALPSRAHGDVTIQQQTTFDFSMFKMHGTSTEMTTTDKQRRDSDMRCDGFMSMLCGNPQSGEIIRVDRALTWNLELKKKQYRETPFPTAADLQAAQQQAQAMAEKMKACPVPKSTTPQPDTSKCEMSQPTIDVKQPGTHATFAGHDTQLTQIALTQSCTNKTTGDVCDFQFAFDSWLTQDQIAGVDDLKAFQEAYRAKIGITPQTIAGMQKQASQFLAPYQDALKQLSAKAGDIKGYPLKTAVRISFGGPHCAAAKSQSNAAGGGSSSAVGDAGKAGADAATSSASGAAGSAAGSAAANAAGNSVAGSVLGSAASAFSSKLVSGMFSHKSSSSSSSSGNSSSGSTSAAPAGMLTIAEITIETSAITPGPVAGSQFEIPAGWTLIPPPPPGKQKEFTCPTASGT
jgi:hypothetical protein